MNMAPLCLRYGLVILNCLFFALKMETVVLQRNSNDSLSVQERADVIAVIFFKAHCVSCSVFR